MKKEIKNQDFNHNFLSILQGRLNSDEIYLLFFSVNILNFIWVRKLPLSKKKPHIPQKEKYLNNLNMKRKPWLSIHFDIFHIQSISTKYKIKINFPYQRWKSQKK